MSRRVIRKLPTPAENAPEEQLWPVQLALFALGGCWAGIVLSVCQIDAPHWTGRPWPWLIAATLVIGGLMYLTLRIPRKIMRRAVMLAIVLSLLVNSGFTIGMAWTKIFSIPGVDQRQITKRKERPEEVVIPEYVMQTIRSRELEQPDIHRPVETGSAEAVATNVRRQQINDIERGNLTSMSDSESSDLEQSHFRIQRQRVESTPRRGDAPSLLSRRPMIQQQPGSQRAKTLQTESVTAEQAPPAPSNTDIAHSAATMTKEALRSPTNARIQDQPLVKAKLARRAEDLADAPATVPQFPQRVRNPNPPPQTDLMAKTVAAVARQTSETATQPRNTQLNRTLTAVTEFNRETRSSELLPILRPTESKRAASVADEARQTATTLRSDRRRHAPLETNPSVQTLVENKQPTATATPTDRLEPRPTDDVSQQPKLSDEIARRVVPRPEPALSRTEQLAVTERPISDADQPAVFDRQQPRPQPTRTSRAAPLATSSIAQSSPAVAVNDTSTSDPTAEPARTAVTRATDGVAGIGNAPNLDRGSNAAIGRADLAAAFARRLRDTQTTEPALAISPSLPARTRSTLSGQNALATPVRAQQVSVARTLGSEVAAEATAAAAATIQRASAAAELAATTAARGDTQIDLGPKRIVRRDRQGRASGGGQPQLNVETQSRLISRSRVGGVRRIAIQSDVAIEVAAPANDGSIPPTVLEANPDASAVVQSATGSISDVARGISSDATVGVPSAATMSPIGMTQASRTETIEAPLAEPAAGGGNRRRRLSSPSAFAANAVAEVPSRMSATESAGRENAEDITALGDSISPVASGVLAIPRDTRVGAVANREPSLGADLAPNLSPTVERVAALPTDNDGDFDGAEPKVHRSLRAARLLLPSTAAAALQVAPAVTSVVVDSEPSTFSDGIAVGDDNLGSVTRDRSMAHPFEREARIGVGGVGDQVAVMAGFDTPRAQPQSEQLQLQDARFIRKNVGSPPTTATRVAVAVDAFRHRLQRRVTSQPVGGLPLPLKTEEAIELGLVYLARHQEPDGRWRLSHGTSNAAPGPKPTLRSDTAATGLSLLAFLGAGYHHLDDKYSNGVRIGLNHLVENQSPDGNLYVRDDDVSASSVALYSHGIAALALCEAYGMTQDEWLQEPAQKALDYVVATQNRRLGGWRYTPQIESDTSVSGWMIMALKSGELAQLNVPASTYDKMTQWLDQAQASEAQRHLYRYNPLAPDTRSQRHGREPTHVMTSVGLLTRMYLGWRRDNEWMQRGGDYLAQHVPQMGTSGSAQRDTYYWYYATQVMFHLGGDYWQEWNRHLHPLLVQEQIQQGPLAGSWNPYAPVPDRWAVHAGRLYVTTMNLLSLEVYYRHLPIYAETGR